MAETVGFIGLGIMGAPMARNLRQAGFEVVAWNRSPERLDAAVADGALRGESPADVARRAEVVVACVRQTEDVEAVLLGSDEWEGAIEGVRAGSVFVDMSTIAPAATRELARRVEARGGAMLDAPVSGGEQGAVAGTLSIMVGGTPEALDRARPMLEAMGARITHCGPSGAGQTVKLCNQIAVVLNNLAMAEALVFCQRSGVDPSTMLEAISAGAAGSWQISNLGPKVVERDFAPGFKVGLQQKDLRLALEAADELHVPLAGTSLVHQLFASVERSHGGDAGTQALVTAIEALAGVEVGRPLD
ncbi:MAG: NAD-binding protein [Dehalococcoidia bacterium]|nr:NAD-binding protein [Dehalococcoidia bacterium]